MKSSTNVKTKKESKVKAFASLDETTKITLSLMCGISAIIGTWAAVSLISALIGVGGLLELTQSWFSAVTGM